MARTVNPAQVAERRARILDALEDAILELGFPRINVKDLALRAGLSQGLLHYYFADKTEMILSLQWRMLEHYNDALWQVTHGDAPAEQRLARLFDVLVTESETLDRGIRIFLQMESEALTNPEVAHGMRVYLQGFHDALERVLAAFPWWRQTPPARRRAVRTFVIGAIKGAYVQHVFLPEAGALSTIRRMLEPMLQNGTVVDFTKPRAVAGPRTRSRG